MDEIVPKFQDSLFTGISSAIPDIAELGIDSILNEGILKDLPMVNMLLGVKSAAQSLHDRNLLRQTLTFIDEFNKGNINEAKKRKYKKKIEDNPKKAEAELGRVLIILNQTIELDKSKILASIFRAYVNEKIDWEIFCEFSEVTRMFFVGDMYDLEIIYQNRTKDYRYFSHGLRRIISLGLVETDIKLISTEDGSETYEEIKLTGIGDEYYKLVSEVMS